MSFCGTIGLRKRWSMIGFSMHCSGLANRLLDLKYKRTHQEFWANEKEAQMRLFHLTNEEREDFLKFAKNLRWFITENKVHDEEYWKAYREHEYTEYEFYKLFEFFPKTKIEALVLSLEKAGNGEQLSDEETKAAMEFLNELSGHARSSVDEGCF